MSASSLTFISEICHTNRAPSWLDGGTPARRRNFIIRPPSSHSSFIRSRLQCHSNYIQELSIITSNMSAFGSPQQQQSSIAPEDCNIPQPGGDGISSLCWSPTANYLVSSNWDGGIRCWEVAEQGGRVQAQAKAMSTYLYFNT